LSKYSYVEAGTSFYGVLKRLFKLVKVIASNKKDLFVLFACARGLLLKKIYRAMRPVGRPDCALQQLGAACA
jgi:hypothetical protein